jgi:hypothetical protein
MSTTQLIQIDEARKALALATTVDEAKEIRDKAEAVRVYLRQQQGSFEAQNYAAELKLRAERRLGELLSEDGERRGGNFHGGSSTPLPDNVTCFGSA